MILVVAATERELDYLDGVPTLVCGIGPVESALATSAALARQPPDAVVHVGIAGARRLPTSTLVIGAEAVYCDVIDPSSSLPRIERESPDADLLETARRALPTARVLPVATSARLGGGEGYEVEAMEGFGVLRAAARARVPAVELRSVSNAVGEPDRACWRIEDALVALAAAVPVLLEALDA